MAAKAKAKAAGKVKEARLTKAGLVAAIKESMGDAVTKEHVKVFLDTLTEIGYEELRKKGTFVMPGFAKYVVAKKAARPERTGKNPFTGEETVFPAKPATKVVRARPVKALKDAIAG